MKRILLLSAVVLAIIFLLPKNVYARSGCCSYHGGVCGCGCCDGTSLSSTCAPYYPECGGGYYNTPIYTPRPICPLFSSYNSLSEECECNYGYVASGNSCISLDQVCKNKYGYSSRYDSLSDACECSYGYIIDSSGKCTSGNTVCSNKYGFNSRFNTLDNTCECSYGYIFNQSGSKCISEDESCKEQYGYGSKATLSGNKCECRYGYEWEGNKCVLETIETIPINIPKISIPTPNLIATTPPLPTVGITNNPEINQSIFIQLWSIIRKLFDNLSK